MTVSTFARSLALFAASTAAQFASYSSDSHALSVNIPSSSASSGSGPIYFQISAPSGTQWVAFGQGSSMSGSNMFVVYAQDSSNVTLSGRAGTGYRMPQHDSSIQLTLLEGSGISSDGAMVANVRCDNCNSWSGGSMSFTDSSSSWIYASLSGSALNSDSVSANIQQHDSMNGFSLDLTQGTGGSSSNPFIAASDTGSSASASASASGTAGSGTATQTASSTSGTNGVSNPLASTDATSGSASRQTSDPNATLTSAHGIIMSLLFLGIFPLAALTLYLPTTKKVRYIHAPLQVVALILLIVGLVLGIKLGQKIHQLDKPHMIIGFVVSFSLILFQPAMGLYQHLHYHRTGGRSIFGVAHRWLGRTMIILGIINGGLGWQLTATQAAYVPYAVVAAIIFLIYISVLVFAWYRSGGSAGKELENEKLAGSPPRRRSVGHAHAHAHGQGQGHEMQSPPRRPVAGNAAAAAGQNGQYYQQNAYYAQQQQHRQYQQQQQYQPRGQSGVSFHYR